MATKLKNISRNRLTKIIVFALSVLMLWLATSDMGYFLFENKNNNISLMTETLFADNFFETSSVQRKAMNSVYYAIETATGEVIPKDWSKNFALLEYRVTDENGDLIMSTDPNRPEDYFRTGNYIVFSDGTITEAGGKLPVSVLSSYHYTSEYSAIISFPDEFWGEDLTNFNVYKHTMANFIGIEARRLAVFLICVIYLIIVAGRKPEDEKIHTTFPDNLWSEIHLFALMMLILAGCMVFVFVIEAYTPYMTTSTFNLTMVLCNIGIILVYSLFMWVFLSLIRKIKAKAFIKCSCIGWCWGKIKAVFKVVFTFMGEFIRNFTGVEFKDVHFAAGFHKIQVRFVTISILMFIAFCFSVFFAIATWGVTQFFWVMTCIAIVILEAFFIWHYIRKTTRYAQSMARLLVQIDKVSSGNLDYYAGIDEGDPLVDSSDKLANISEGLSEALEEQMKGERMKIELITNVSHDLKTPLTSIISYIDLLKKEEMNDAAKDYVNILAQKADRLKGIVSDLFDLAKTNSGNAQLDIKPLDFTKLTNQILGDMEDKITESGMKIKLNLPDSPAVITADGKKLSRALQNVLDNALKYSLNGSRIYIDLVKNEGNAILSVKNTSSYEMDFTADEIMQRFVRGDKNRSSDGSGLGLSIAQSFTQVSGGSFDVMIDGDQFKTVFTFPLTDEKMNSGSGDII